MRPGQFVWNDLVTPEVDAAQGFFEELLGWKARRAGDKTVLEVASSSRPVPVCSVERGEQPHWRPYLDVADLDAHLERVGPARGRVVAPPCDHPMGRSAIVAGPSGATYSAIQLSSKRAAPAIAPGRVVWHQLMTTDLDASLGFYQTVFGWERHGPPGWHAFVCKDMTDLGVISQEPEPRGATWLAYLQVEDVCAVVERAVALHATVIFKPLEVAPLGKLAVLVEPSGLAFGLINRTVSAGLS